MKFRINFVKYMIFINFVIYGPCRKLIFIISFILYLEYYNVDAQK